MNSGHEVRIVPIKLEPHPNADQLSLVLIDGYTIVVRTEDWKDKSIGAYIPPDNVVPNLPEYDFLGSSKRIKVRKFRGITSQGLLVDAPKGSKLGDNVADQLGVKHYEPPVKGYQGEQKPSPFPNIPIYDVEHYLKYSQLLEGEEVIISEKIHGSSWRGTYYKGEYHVGSHRVWRRSWEEENNFWNRLKRAKSFRHILRIIFGDKPKVQYNLYWQVLKNNPWLQDILRNNPDHVFYGEVYGDVQKLKYNHKPGIYSIKIFDVWYQGQYLMPKITRDLVKENYVPVLYEGKFTDEICKSLYEGKSALADHIKEGIVIRPITEKWDHRCGRVVLKLVSNEYLEKD